MAGLSPRDIGYQAHFLLAEFLRERLERFGMQTLVPEEAQPPGLPHAAKIGAALRKIADDLDGRYDLNSMVSKISRDDQQQSFFLVAREVFSDGVYNWGRIVTLFYFAFKLICRAESNIASIARDVINWVVSFIVDTVAGWIIERGGWEAIQEHFGATSFQVSAIVLASVVVCAFILWRRS